jgi:DNA polymerase-3 subunit epsilon
MYSHINNEGYLAITIDKADGRKKEITSFVSLQEGKNFLFKLTSENQLCQKINGLYETKTACFQYKIKECNGACIQLESPETYNTRAQDSIDKLQFENNNMVVVDKGRGIEERSAVLIENGVYKGYCFFDLNYQITNIDILKNIIIPMQNNRDTTSIIKNHIRKNRVMRIIKF